MQQRGQAQEAEREASQTLAELEQELQALAGAVNEAVLAQAATVQQMHERLGSHKKAAIDRARLETELRGIENDARTILRGLRPELDLDGGRAAAHVHAGAAADPGAGAAAAGTGAGRRLGRRLCAEDRAMPSTRRTAGWPSSRPSAMPPACGGPCAGWSRPGPVQAQRDELRAAVRRDEEQAEIDRRALPLFSGSLEELERLPVPAAEVIECRETELR